MKRNRRAVLVYIPVFFVLSWLPVIPVRMAPVVPNPVYRLTFISLWAMICRLGRVGVSYRWGWDTGAAVLALIAFGIVVGAYWSRKLMHSSLALKKDIKSETGDSNGATK